MLALSWDHLLSGTWVLIPVFVFFAGANGPSVFGALFSESFPARIRATGVSSALRIGRSMSFPPLVAAALAPTVGYRPIVWASALMFALLGVVAWGFTEMRGEALDESAEAGRR